MVHVAVAISGLDLEDLTVEIIFEICRLPGVRIAAAGDDSVLIVPRRVFWRGQMREVDMTRVEEIFGAFGFRVPKDKQKLSTDLRDIVFLGQMPFPVMVENRVKWFWGPTLGRRLFKHHHCLKPQGDLRAWLHGVADMEKRCYPHVPILYDMACSVLDQMEGQKRNTYVDHDAQYKVRMELEGTPHYDDVTVAHVEWYYDVPPGTVREAIAELGVIPQVLMHPIYERMLLTDDC
jgi:hypothetical protein